MENGAAARRDRMDRHHRRADAHASDLRIECALKCPCIKRDIGRCAAHIEADDVFEAGSRRCAGGADDAAGRAGQNGILALEAQSVDQTAIRLNEVELDPAEFGGDAIDIAAQDWRKIRVDDRCIATRDQAQQWTDLMARRDLRKSRGTCELCDPAFVIGIFPGVQKHDGASREIFSTRRLQSAPCGGLVERFDFRAVTIDATGDFDHFLVKNRRPDDIEVEQTWPRLIADRQSILKTAIDDEQRRLAFAFKQSIRSHSGADLDRLDQAVRDAVTERNTEQLFDAGDGRVGIARRIFAQKLVRDERPVRPAGNDVRKSAAAINPELPAGPHRLPNS